MANHERSKKNAAGTNDGCRITTDTPVIDGIQREFGDVICIRCADRWEVKVNNMIAAGETIEDAAEKCLRLIRRMVD